MLLSINIIPLTSVKCFLMLYNIFQQLPIVVLERNQLPNSIVFCSWLPHNTVSVGLYPTVFTTVKFLMKSTALKLQKLQIISQLLKACNIILVDYGNHNVHHNRWMNQFLNQFHAFFPPIVLGIWGDSLRFVCFLWFSCLIFKYNNNIGFFCCCLDLWLNYISTLISNIPLNKLCKYVNLKY